MSSFFFARLLHCFCCVEKLYIAFDWGLNRTNAFSPIVQTKPAENVDKNGRFRTRFQKWSLLKTNRFETALVLLWIGKNGNFWKPWAKRARRPWYTVVSFSVFAGVLAWTIGENKSKSVRFPTTENALSVDRWKQTQNTSVKKNLLRFRWEELGYFKKRISVVQHTNKRNWVVKYSW